MLPETWELLKKRWWCGVGAQQRGLCATCNGCCNKLPLLLKCALLEIRKNRHCTSLWMVYRLKFVIIRSGLLLVLSVNLRISFLPKEMTASNIHSLWVWCLRLSEVLLFSVLTYRVLFTYPGASLKIIFFSHPVLFWQSCSQQDS